MALMFTFIIYWQVDMVTARNERAGDDNKKNNLGLDQELEGHDHITRFLIPVTNGNIWVLQKKMYKDWILVGSEVNIKFPVSPGLIYLLISIYNT